MCEGVYPGIAVKTAMTGTPKFPSSSTPAYKLPMNRAFVCVLGVVSILLVFGAQVGLAGDTSASASGTGYGVFGPWVYGVRVVDDVGNREDLPRTALAVLSDVSVAEAAEAEGAEVSSAVLVVRLGFQSNLGRVLWPPCDSKCALDALWDATPFAVADLLDNGSEGRVTLDKGASSVTDVYLNDFASVLECDVGTWADEALLRLGAAARGFKYILYLLPVEAGGGACARYQELATLNCAVANTWPCEMWLRNFSRPYWARAFGHVFGRVPANEDTSNPFAHNRLDVWSRLTVPDRYELGWLRDYTADIVRTPQTGPPYVIKVVSGSLYPAWGVLWVLHSAAGPWYVSARASYPSSDGRLDLDQFLDAAHSNKVFVHTNQTLMAVLGQGDTYVNTDVDFAVTVLTSVDFVANVAVHFCVRVGGTILLAPGSSATNDTVLTATYTNQDSFCAPRPDVRAECREWGSVSTCNVIEVFIAPDVNRVEISYKVFDQAGVVLMQGGWEGASVKYCGERDTVLRAEFYDGGGDGYCCQYGGGSYWQVKMNGVVVGTGGRFQFREVFWFRNTLVWNFGAVASGRSSASTAVVTLSSQLLTLPSIFVCTVTSADAAVFQPPVVVVPFAVTPTATPTPTSTTARIASRSDSGSVSGSVSASVSRTSSSATGSSHSSSNTRSITRSNTRSNTRLKTLSVSMSAARSSSRSLSRSKSASRSRSKTLSSAP